MNLCGRRGVSVLITASILVTLSAFLQRSMMMFSSDSLNTQDHFITQLTDANVLILGDGDFSFTRSLSRMKICNSITSTTLDRPQRLFACFPNAEKNVRDVEEAGDRVMYEIDATDIKLEVDEEFDIIMWNFPHIIGKQNIKYNRQLLQSFLRSASDCSSLSTTGKIMVSLCSGQSGTRAFNKNAWDKSWKLTAQAAEVGLFVVRSDPFIADSFPGYIPMGHRGHGGSFLLGKDAEVFTLQKSPKQIHLSSLLENEEKEIERAASAEEESSVAYQAPVYVHEVHMLQENLVPDIEEFEQAVKVEVELILGRLWREGLTPVSDPLWGLCVVDLYPCPKRHQLVHVVQIAYASLKYALSRAEADVFCSYMEQQLPRAMNMSPREERMGKRISQPYGWYVADALRQHPPPNRSIPSLSAFLQLQHKENEEDGTSNTRTSLLHKEGEDGHDDDDMRLPIGGDRPAASAEAEITPTLVSVDDAQNIEYIRAVARSLWKYRVGMLAHGQLEENGSAAAVGAPVQMMKKKKIKEEGEIQLQKIPVE